MMRRVCRVGRVERLSSSLRWMAGAGLLAVLGGCIDPGVLYLANANIATVAGTGVADYTGDGGPAKMATLSGPGCAAIDTAGNLLIADTGNNVVRRVAAGNQTISTVAGNGNGGYTGDGGPATAAALQFPSGCALDGANNIYIADTFNQVVREVNAATGVITTIVGDGTGAGKGGGAFFGDGGPAAKAELSLPSAIVVAKNGDIYIADTSNNRIRKVTAATGVINTVAGNGGATTPNSPYTGDGGAATSAPLASPQGMALDGSGNLYFADTAHNAIRRVDGASGVITTVAGTGLPGYAGDGAKATAATLLGPAAVSFDANGNLYIADSLNHVVREVAVSTGIISTIAGTGVSGYSGDGGLATKATMRSVGIMAFDAKGNLYLPDPNSNVVRELSF